MAATVIVEQCILDMLKAFPALKRTWKTITGVVCVMTSPLGYDSSSGRLGAESSPKAFPLHARLHKLPCVAI